MEINKHICFCDDEDPQLIRYLQKHNITYDKGDTVSALDIYESNPHWTFIEKYAQKNDLFCLSEAVFSKEELKNAEWMEVRSVWHYSYPQPEDDFGYETITYTRQHHCRECGQGLEQVDSFRIKKPPNWGKRHLMMLNWIEDEFFVDEVAKTLFEKEFPFITFMNVKNKSGNEVWANIFQMILPVLEEKGMVEEQRRLREVLLCPCCGQKKYHLNGLDRLKLQRKIFTNAPAIAKTAEWFGWGKGASHHIVINQEMYQFLLSNHLEKNLEFSPIELVD